MCAYCHYSVCVPIVTGPTEFWYSENFFCPYFLTLDLAPGRMSDRISWEFCGNPGHYSVATLSDVGKLELHDIHPFGFLECLPLLCTAVQASFKREVSVLEDRKLAHAMCMSSFSDTYMWPQVVIILRHSLHTEVVATGTKSLLLRHNQHAHALKLCREGIFILILYVCMCA